MVNIYSPVEQFQECTILKLKGMQNQLGMRPNYNFDHPTENIPRR